MKEKEDIIYIDDIKKDYSCINDYLSSTGSKRYSYHICDKSGLDEFVDEQMPFYYENGHFYNGKCYRDLLFSDYEKYDIVNAYLVKKEGGGKGGVWPDDLELLIELYDKLNQFVLDNPLAFEIGTGVLIHCVPVAFKAIMNLIRNSWNWISLLRFAKKNNIKLTEECIRTDLPDNYNEEKRKQIDEGLYALQKLYGYGLLGDISYTEWIKSDKFRELQANDPHNKKLIFKITHSEGTTGNSVVRYIEVEFIATEQTIIKDLYGYFDNVLKIGKHEAESSTRFCKFMVDGKRVTAIDDFKLLSFVEINKLDINGIEVDYSYNGIGGGEYITDKMKFFIPSSEKNHIDRPHIHVSNSKGDNAVVFSLLDTEILAGKDNFKKYFTRKERKNVLKCLEKYRLDFIGFYYCLSRGIVPKSVVFKFGKENKECVLKQDNKTF